MTDATKLLLDLLAVIPDGEKVAAFFAEDGVVELPYLHTIGIPTVDDREVRLYGGAPPHRSRPRQSSTGSQQSATAAPSARDGCALPRRTGSCGGDY
jgi:hypothetical protein